MSARLPFPRTFHPARRAQSGVSLIESLVALLILSLGLLGIVGLQLSSVRFQQGSWARNALASTMVDFAERMRANPSATSTAYQLTDSYDDQRKAIDTGAVQVATDCNTTTCDPAKLAAFDLATWRLALDRVLPASAAYITGNRDTGYVATMMWFDKDFLGSDGKPAASATCAATDTGFQQRTCCPKDAKAANGVRCVTLTVLP